MKKFSLVCLVLICTAMLFSCVAKDNGSAISDVTPAPQKSDSAQSQQVSESDEATPTQTPVQGASSVKLKLNTPTSVNGLTITLSAKPGNDLDKLYATVNDTEFLLTDGDFVSAYLCGLENGDTGIVLCSFMWESQVINLYSVTDDAVDETCEIYGEVIDVNGNTMKMTSSIDVLGTWKGIKICEFLDGMSVATERTPEWEVEADETRALIALCDIQAKDADTDEASVILTGSKLLLFKTDASTYAILKDVQSGSLYKVEVKSTGYGSYTVGDVPEEECFSNIMYAG